MTPSSPRSIPRFRSWRLALSIALAVLAIFSVSVHPAAAQSLLHVVVEADSPPLEPPACPFCLPPHFCLPSNFSPTQAQPVADMPPEAYGYCSDGVGYFAAHTEGSLVYFGETTAPFEIELTGGTDLSYALVPFEINVDCDGTFLGMPGPLASPCWLTRVRVTDTLSEWFYEDATRTVPFSLIGDAPTARLPEPGFASGLGAALVGLVAAARRRSRKALIPEA